MRLVILDRDGVINYERDAYVRSPDEWRPIPGSLEAIARLCREDYRVVVATNQSGIGRHLLDVDTLNRIHARMLDYVRKKGGEIDAIFFCPHTPQNGCDCRKPEPGMLEDIAGRLKINLTGVPVVGDSLRDLKAAKRVNALPVLVLSGKNELGLNPGGAITDPEFAGSPVFADLAQFTDALLQGQLADAMDALSGGTGG